VGTSVASATINVYVNGTLAKTVTADAGGNWSANSVALNLGANSITAVATVSGRVSPSSAAYSARYYPDGFVASANIQSTTNTFTFSNVNIGQPVAGRVVAVAVACDNGNLTGGNVSAVTIGGVTALKAVENGNGVVGSSIWYAVVPTGTTANIVVTHTGANTSRGCGIGVFAFLPTASTPDASNQVYATTPANLTLGVNTQANSFVIAAAGYGAESGVGIKSMSGVTLSFNQAILTYYSWQGAGFAADVPAGTPTNIGVTYNAASYETFVVATWH
jgi:hypothetical protein